MVHCFAFQYSKMGLVVVCKTKDFLRISEAFRDETMGVESLHEATSIGSNSKRNCDTSIYLSSSSIQYRYIDIDR